MLKLNVALIPNFFKLCMIDALVLTGSLICSQTQ